MQNLSEDDLYQDFTVLCRGIGCELVDLRYQQTRHGHAVQIVIHKTKGVSTEDCAQVYRTGMARLEVVLESQDIHLEVSSPGIDRKIRLNREYPLFINKGFRFHTKDSQTIKALLLSCNDNGLEVRTKDGIQSISYSEISKAVLDDDQEVR